LHSFAAMENALDEKEKKKNIVKALDDVSARLGNSRTVCKKYYVHPAIITMYEQDKLKNYLNELNLLEVDDNKSGLTASEKLLMKVIQSGSTDLSNISFK